METPADNSGGLGSELRGDARTVTDAATQRLHSEVDARKGGAVEQVKTLSSAIGKTANELGADTPSWLRSALERASQTIQKVADGVENKDSRQLTRDLQDVARNNPGTFLAASALAGFAAARVLQAGTRGSANTAQSFAGQGSSQRPALQLAGTSDPYVAETPYAGAPL